MEYTVFSVVLIGLSLSLDAFAVSVCSGISAPNLRRFYTIRASLFFGLFQFIMPVTGWFLGMSFVTYIQAYDHWVAFGLLAFIGGKMLLEGIRHKKGGGSDAGEANVRDLKTLLILAIATSIDALAVGLTFSMLGGGIWLEAALIGVITFVVCNCGFEFGRRVGTLLEKWAAISGGVILIGIGLKILIEHLTA
jgi:putative Mn2+ efflux pump MntP